MEPVQKERRTERTATFYSAPRCRSNLSPNPSHADFSLSLSHSSVKYFTRAFALFIPQVFSETVGIWDLFLEKKKNHLYLNKKNYIIFDTKWLEYDYGKPSTETNDLRVCILLTKSSSGVFFAVYLVKIPRKIFYFIITVLIFYFFHFWQSKGEKVKRRHH